MESVNNERTPNTPEELYNFFIKEKADRSQTDKNEYRIVYRILDEILRQKGRKTIGHFSAKEAEIYRDIVFHRYSKSTATNRLNRAKTLFSFAIKNRFIKNDNPFANLKQKTKKFFGWRDLKDQIRKIEKQIAADCELAKISKEEEKDQIDCEFRDYSYLLEVIRYAGLRLNETAIFVYNHDYDEYVIEIISRKENRILPLFDELRGFKFWSAPISCNNLDFFAILRNLEIDKGKLIEDCRTARIKELLEQGYDSLCICRWFSVDPKSIQTDFKSDFEDVLRRQLRKELTDI